MLTEINTITKVIAVATTQGCNLQSCSLELQCGKLTHHFLSEIWSKQNMTECNQVVYSPPDHWLCHSAEDRKENTWLLTLWVCCVPSAAILSAWLDPLYDPLPREGCHTSSNMYQNIVQTLCPTIWHSSQQSKHKLLQGSIIKDFQTHIYQSINLSI